MTNKLTSDKKLLLVFIELNTNKNNYKLMKKLVTKPNLFQSYKLQK